MKRIIAILCIVCFGLALFISGCTQQDKNGTNNNNGGSTTGKTITMTAKEVESDMNFTSDWQTYMKFLYNSLEDGDTLIIHDTIDNISFDPEMNRTKVTFDTSEEGDMSSSMNYPFQGDLTGTYLIGDTVKITDKIKHVEFTDDSTGATISYELEIFEKMWTNKEEYVASEGGALPATCITKI